MRLVDLNPSWVGAGGEGVSAKDGTPVPKRHGIGIMFDCPCGCAVWVYVSFENPVDGGPPRLNPGLNPGEPRWHRTGDTFDALTLKPSILKSKKKGGCGWHGFVTNGEITGRVEG